MIPTCPYCGRWQQRLILRILGQRIDIWACRIASCRERELREMAGQLSFTGVES